MVFAKMLLKFEKRHPMKQFSTGTPILELRKLGKRDTFAVIKQNSSNH